MKPYPNLVAGVLEVLEKAFGKRLYADKVLQQVLRANKKWGSRDRAFVAEHSYEMVRYWRLIWHLADAEPSLKRKHLKRLFEVYWQWREDGRPLPEDLPLGVRESFPEWLDELASAELGDAWPDVAVALNRPSHVILRCNSLHGTREDVLSTLTSEGIDASISDVAPDALVLAKRPKLQRLNSFQDGLYEVQDGGSQLLASYLELQPGMKLLDGCSGAGGKALHAAALMRNHGEILCMDVQERKLSELNKRAARNGVNIIRTEHIRSAADVTQHEGWADAMLLDVPCSGTGVIRRDVDTKWKLKPEHLDRTRDLQRQILHKYPEALRSGGRLVYATCSILRSENEDQVADFMAAQGDAFELIEQKRISPEHPHSDAYFVAVFRKR